jgi:hypothetical protein
MRWTSLRLVLSRPAVGPVYGQAMPRASSILRSSFPDAVRRIPAGPDAGGGQRADGLRLRGRGPALRAGVPWTRGAQAHLRRRRRGGADPDGCLHERRIWQDGQVSAARARCIRAEGGKRDLETVGRRGSGAERQPQSSPRRKPECSLWRWGSPDSHPGESRGPACGDGDLHVDRFGVAIRAKRAPADQSQ